MTPALNAHTLKGTDWLRESRLQGDLHVFMTQAYVSFQFLGHSSYLFSNLLLKRIADMDNNDAR